MGLKIIGTIGCQFRPCLDEQVPVLNKDTGLYDLVNKRIFTGPLVKLYPVYPKGSKAPKYFTAEVELDEPNSANPEYFNLKTGKPVSYTDAIMSLTKSSKHMLEEGQIAVAVTPDTVEAVKEALKLGFPANRVNDALGLLNPANKVQEPVKQQIINVEEVTFDESEVAGIRDLENLPEEQTEVVEENVEKLLDEAVEKGIVEKKGSWYDLKTAKIGPGKAKALESLENAPELISILKGETKPNPNAQDAVGVS